MGNLGMELGNRSDRTGRVCVELSIDDIYEIVASRLIQEGHLPEEIVMQIDNKFINHEWTSEVIGAKIYISY